MEQICLATCENKYLQKQKHTLANTDGVETEILTYLPKWTQSDIVA